MIRLQMVRQMVSGHVESSTDTDLQTLVWLDRKEIALSHARLRDAPEARCRGLLAVYEALRARDQADEALLEEALEVAQAIPYERLQAEALAALAAAWAQADKRFHTLVVDYCGNNRLRSMINDCWDQAHRARLLTLGLRPRPTRSNREHRATLAAIVRGDAEAACQLHREHHVRAGRMLVELLTAAGLAMRSVPFWTVVGPL